MLKKILTAAFAAAMIAGFTACSSVDTGTTLNGIKLSDSDSATVAHINAKVWGIYFFNMLPLFTGSTSHPGTCAIFRDTVQIDNAVNMVTKKAKKLDATKIVDLRSSTTNICTLFLSYKSIELSGNAVK